MVTILLAEALAAARPTEEVDFIASLPTACRAQNAAWRVWADAIKQSKGIESTTAAAAEAACEQQAIDAARSLARIAAGAEGAAREEAEAVEAADGEEAPTANENELEDAPFGEVDRAETHILLTVEEEVLKFGGMDASSHVAIREACNGYIEAVRSYSDEASQYVTSDGQGDRGRPSAPCRDATPCPLNAIRNSVKKRTTSWQSS